MLKLCFAVCGSEEAFAFRAIDFEHFFVVNLAFAPFKSSHITAKVSKHVLDYIMNEQLTHLADWFDTKVLGLGE